jgi:hypothetical protein
VSRNALRVRFLLNNEKSHQCVTQVDLETGVKEVRKQENN